MNQNNLETSRIIPLAIHIDGKNIGIEYKEGEYTIYGQEHMDAGVKFFFEVLKERLQASGCVFPDNQSPLTAKPDMG